MRLFDAPSQRWTGSRALQFLTCPWCDTPIDQLVTWIQAPLFSHGGYGEATRHDTRTCVCGLTLVSSRSSVNPRPYR